MTRPTVPALAACLLALSCGALAAAGVEMPRIGSDAVAAKVAGTVITVGEVDAFAKVTSRDGKVDAASRRTALRNLVRIVALASMPEAATVAARPETAFIRQIAGLGVLAETALREKAATMKPDEASMRREYDGYVASMKGKREISLLEVVSPDEAKAAATAAAFAADGSVDRQAAFKAAAAAQGVKVVDVSKSPEDRLLPAVRAVAVKLPAGSTFGPLKTPFGTIVGYVVATGDAVVKSFEEMRPGYERAAGSRVPAAVTTKAIADAHVEILDKDLLPAPPSVAPRAAPIAPAPVAAVPVAPAHP